MLKETERFRGRKLKDEVNENDEVDSDDDFNENKSEKSEGKKANVPEKRPGYNRLKKFIKEHKNDYHLSTGPEPESPFVTDLELKM